MKFILDASVVVKLYLEEEHADMVEQLVDQALAGEVELLVPSFMLLEVNNALVKSSLSRYQRETALELLFQLITDRVLKVQEVDLFLLKKAGEIADLDTHGHGYVSAYDALYHALAIVEGGVFVTDDLKHIAKTKPIGHVIALTEWEALK